MKATFSVVAVVGALLSAVSASPVSAQVSSAPAKPSLLMADILPIGYQPPVCGVSFNRFTTDYIGTIYGSMFDSKTDSKGMSLTCNKCVLLHGKQDVNITVVGFCEGCGENSFEVTTPVLTKLTGKPSNLDGIQDIPWEWIDC
ncbi:hypothetical protein H4R26_001279 [Coemansia thaxteri]|uniref:Uncharacterized protein n=1 Tax=Coemansia thaxteri TaxID=2663907 RepID=A0A9W8EKM5_9FUNG|nr:hypothetical protein H4R26_001279 [Coemansia thaxteri]